MGQKGIPRLKKTSLKRLFKGISLLVYSQTRNPRKKRWPGEGGFHRLLPPRRDALLKSDRSSLTAASLAHHSSFFVARPHTTTIKGTEAPRHRSQGDRSSFFQVEDSCLASRRILPTTGQQIRPLIWGLSVSQW
jgi:hypothetical protein